MTAIPTSSSPTTAKTTPLLPQPGKGTFIDVPAAGFDTKPNTLRPAAWFDSDNDGLLDWW